MKFLFHKNNMLVEYSLDLDIVNDIFDSAISFKKHQREADWDNWSKLVLTMGEQITDITSNSQNYVSHAVASFLFGIESASDDSISGIMDALQDSDMRACVYGMTAKRFDWAFYTDLAEYDEAVSIYSELTTVAGNA
jgi:hypothetical protein